MIAKTSFNRLKTLALELVLKPVPILLKYLGSKIDFLKKNREN